MSASEHAWVDVAQRTRKLVGRRKTPGRHVERSPAPRLMTKDAVDVHVRGGQLGRDRLYSPAPHKGSSSRTDCILHQAMPRLSFYTQGYGPDLEALKRAFSWLGNRAVADPAKRQILLAISQLSNLDGALEDFLGTATVKRLRKREVVSVPPLNMTLLVERDRNTSWDGLVVAVYPSRSLLDKMIA